MDVAPFGTDDQLITISDAARLLGLSASRVRQLADAGELPVLKTASGVRLFHQHDVAKLVAQRFARAKVRSVHSDGSAHIAVPAHAPRKELQRWLR